MIQQIKQSTVITVKWITCGVCWTLDTAGVLQKTASMNVTYTTKTYNSSSIHVEFTHSRFTIRDNTCFLSRVNAEACLVSWPNA